MFEAVHCSGAVQQRMNQVDDQQRLANRTADESQADAAILGDDAEPQQTPTGKAVQDANGGPDIPHKIHQTGNSGYANYDDGSELFRADSGGKKRGTSNASRSEAVISPDGGTANKTFSADFKVDGASNANIFQMKVSGGQGPSLRVSINDDNEIVVHNADGSPEAIGNVQPGQKFNLAVTDNGDGTATVATTDESGGSIGNTTVPADRGGSAGPSEEFRYGMYLQKGEDQASVAISDVNVTG